MPAKKRFVVVGAGSIGKRHARLLGERDDLEVEIVEPNAEALAIAKKEAGDVKSYASFDEMLKTRPDIFIIDGQGIAHPRRLGLAAHLGLFFDKPTIGCAKSRLTGYFEEPPPEKGAYSFLRDTERAKSGASDGRRATSDEVIGAVVRTRTNVKPLFVSVGNKCLLKDAIKITLCCAIKYRLPEPTRLAHQLVGKLRLKA